MRKIMKLVLFMLLFLLVVGVGIVVLSWLHGGIDRRTVTTLSREQLLGHWYEVGRFNHSFERGLSDVEVAYSLQPDGSIRVENSGWEEHSGRRRVAIGRAKTTRQPGHLRVSFFWRFYSDYNVLEYDEEGGWMVVGSRSPRYLWILSRRPTLPPAALEHALDLARLRGYDTSKLILRDRQ